MDSKVSKDMFRTWMNDPVTEEFMSVVIERREVFIECMRQVVSENDGGRQLAAHVGAINELTKVLNLEHHDLVEEVEDEE